MEVNGITYLFDFPSESTVSRKEASEQLAKKFCHAHADKLGLKLGLKAGAADEGALAARCARPLAQALRTEAEKKLRAAQRVG